VFISFIYLFIYFVCLLYCTEVQTWGFTLARQVLYCLMASSPFLLVIFETGSSNILPGLAWNHYPPDLNLL
jgi:hypothetical protein